MADEGLAEIVKLTGTFGLTFMAILFEEAGLPVPQTSDDVRIHVITSPFAKAEFE
jgi:hypothetical protein